MSAEQRLQRVLDKLHNVKREGDRYKALCPAHDDHNPSLTVSINRKTDWVDLKCWSHNCEPADIARSIGMELHDLGPERERRQAPTKTVAPLGPVVTRYLYHDEHGEVLFSVTRHQAEGGKKDFRQWTPNGEGGWKAGIGKARRVLYRLPDVVAAVKADKAVWIAEGEKDADALAKLGLCGTTSAMGAGKWRDSYSQSLHRAKVCILPDNDEPGRDHAATVAKSLHGVAASVKVVDLPDLPPKGDVSDWLALGHNQSDLIAAAKAAPLWEPEAEPADTRPSSDSHVTGHPEGAAARLDPHRLHDVGNAARIVERHGDEVRYCYAWQSWLTWDGRRWATDTSGDMARRAKDTAIGIYSEVAAGRDEAERESIFKHARRSQSAQAIGAALKLAECERPVKVDDLDIGPFVLNAQNGTVDLLTGRLRPHNKADMLTMLAPVAYDADATCPTFERFLERIMPDPELRAYLQRAVGYSLTGDVSAQCLFFLYGSGANGKSTLLDLLAGLLGDYSWRAPGDLLLIKKGGTDKEGVANLHRRRFVATVEVESGARLAESLTKELTGGDTMNARRLYQHEFTFRPTHKLWLAANHHPGIRGTDHAIWRRIHVIPFTVSIPEAEQDATLPDRLRAELPGVLRWAVEGCVAWNAEGRKLEKPQAMADAVAEYREEQDTIGAFIAERCQVGPRLEEQASRLYKAYATWCETNNEGRPISQTAFGRELEQRGHGKRNDRTGKFRQGLRLVGGGLVDDDEAVA